MKTIYLGYKIKEENLVLRNLLKIKISTIIKNVREQHDELIKSKPENGKKIKAINKKIQVYNKSLNELNRMKIW